ncbi:MAG TPA: deoxyribonuclease V [Candidatus Paceibacterota bacterium]|nr:deoxyribonuclease V [Candidatus Paceibacterota bacterium]
MKKSPHHKWDLSPREAIALQKQLRQEIKLETLAHVPRRIAGADVSSNRFSNTLYAGIIVLSFPGLEPVAQSTAKLEATMPYIPGLLSFREIPALLKAWDGLELKPDLLIVDGQGIAHPRRLGIASHFGLLIDRPTIGCAKTILYGNSKEPGLMPGSRSKLKDRGNPDEIIGELLRSKVRSNPLVISPGHRITVDESVSIVQACLRGYRLPEPTRLAHKLVNGYRRSSNE